MHACGTHRALDGQRLAVPARQEPASQGPVDAVCSFVYAAGVAEDAIGLQLVPTPEAGRLTGAIGTPGGLPITPLAVAARAS